MQYTYEEASQLSICGLFGQIVSTIVPRLWALITSN